MASTSAPGQTERARLGALGSADEDLERVALPARRVVDRLRVRREARGGDHAAPERQLLEARRLERARRAGRRRGRPLPRRQDGQGDEGPDPLRPSRPHRRGRGRRLVRRRRDGRFGKVVAHVGEVAREVLGRAEAILGVLGEAAVDEPAHGRRHARVELRHGIRLFADDRRQRLRVRPALEGAFAGRELVDDRTEGKLIRPKIQRTARRLLRRHVPHRAHDHAGTRRVPHRGLQRRNFLVFGRHELRQTEVEDLGEAVLGDHDVLRASGRGARFPPRAPRPGLRRSGPRSRGASSTGTGPEATRSFSVPPSTSSIAMYTVESCVPMS